MKHTSLLALLAAAMMMSCTTKSTQNLDFAGYLFAYFEGGGDPHQQEQQRFAVSEDAMNWHALNGTDPSLPATPSAIAAASETPISCAARRTATTGLPMPR